MGDENNTAVEQIKIEVLPERYRQQQRDIRKTPLQAPLTERQPQADMFLIPRLLCLLGLLALGSVHTSPLTEVKLQNDPLALDTVHTAALAEVKLHRGSCPMFWFEFNGRCYKYVATDFTWADAEWNCLSQDANLVSIHSVEEHNFVRTLIQNFDPKQGLTWIGLSDTHSEGRWMWSDGCKVTFTLWNSHQPNNAGGIEHCVEINHGGSKWNDRPCAVTYPSVCASRKVCPQ